MILCFFIVIFFIPQPKVYQAKQIEITETKDQVLGYVSNEEELAREIGKWDISFTPFSKQITPDYVIRRFTRRDNDYLSYISAAIKYLPLGGSPSYLKRTKEMHSYRDDEFHITPSNADGIREIGFSDLFTEYGNYHIDVIVTMPEVKYNYTAKFNINGVISEQESQLTIPSATVTQSYDFEYIAPEIVVEYCYVDGTPNIKVEAGRAIPDMQHLLPEIYTIYYTIPHLSTYTETLRLKDVTLDKSKWKSDNYNPHVEGKYTFPLFEVKFT